MAPTPNFGLSQLSDDEKIQVSGYNADMLKIDSAIKNAVQTAVVSGLTITTGDYKGTVSNKNGDNVPTTEEAAWTINTTITPYLVLVQDNTAIDRENSLYPSNYYGLFIRNALYTMGNMTASSGYACVSQYMRIVWKDDSVGWYYTDGSITTGWEGIGLWEKNHSYHWLCIGKPIIKS